MVHASRCITSGTSIRIIQDLSWMSKQGCLTHICNFHPTTPPLILPPDCVKSVPSKNMQTRSGGLATRPETNAYCESVERRIGNFLTYDKILGFFRVMPDPIVILSRCQSPNRFALINHDPDFGPLPRLKKSLFFFLRSTHEGEFTSSEWPQDHRTDAWVPQWTRPSASVSWV